MGVCASCTDVYQMAASGDVQALSAAIKVNSELVNKRSDDKRRLFCGTVLHVAVMNNKAHTVAWLLQNGANPLMENSNGDTAVHIAVSKNFCNIMATFVHYFASPLRSDKLEKLLTKKNRKNQLFYTIRDMPLKLNDGFRIVSSAFRNSFDTNVVPLDEKKWKPVSKYEDPKPKKSSSSSSGGSKLIAESNPQLDLLRIEAMSSFCQALLLLDVVTEEQASASTGTIFRAIETGTCLSELRAVLNVAGPGFYVMQHKVGNKYHAPAIHIAVYNSQMDVVRLLLEKGGTDQLEEAIDSHRNTILHAVVKRMCETKDDSIFEWLQLHYRHQMEKIRYKTNDDGFRPGEIADRRTSSRSPRTGRLSPATSQGSLGRGSSAAMMGLPTGQPNDSFRAIVDDLRKQGGGLDGDQQEKRPSGGRNGLIGARHGSAPGILNFPQKESSAGGGGIRDSGSFTDGSMTSLTVGGVMSPAHSRTQQQQQQQQMNNSNSLQNSNNLHFSNNSNNLPPYRPSGGLEYNPSDIQMVSSSGTFASEGRQGTSSTVNQLFTPPNNALGTSGGFDGGSEPSSSVTVAHRTSPGGGNSIHNNNMNNSGTTSTTTNQHHHQQAHPALRSSAQRNSNQQHQPLPYPLDTGALESEWTGGSYSDISPNAFSVGGVNTATSNNNNNNNNNLTTSTTPATGVRSNEASSPQLGGGTSSNNTPSSSGGGAVAVVGNPHVMPPQLPTVPTTGPRTPTKDEAEGFNSPRRSIPRRTGSSSMSTTPTGSQSRGGKEQRLSTLILDNTSSNNSRRQQQLQGELETAATPTKIPPPARSYSGTTSNPGGAMGITYSLGESQQSLGSSATSKEEGGVMTNMNGNNNGSNSVAIPPSGGRVTPPLEGSLPPGGGGLGNSSGGQNNPSSTTPNTSTINRSAGAGATGGGAALDKSDVSGASSFTNQVQRVNSYGNSPPYRPTNAPNSGGMTGVAPPAVAALEDFGGDDDASSSSAAPVADNALSDRQRELLMLSPSSSFSNSKRMSSSLQGGGGSMSLPAPPGGGRGGGSSGSPSGTSTPPLQHQQQASVPFLKKSNNSGSQLNLLQGPGVLTLPSGAEAAAPTAPPTGGILQKQLSGYNNNTNEQTRTWNDTTATGTGDDDDAPPSEENTATGLETTEQQITPRNNNDLNDQHNKVLQGKKKGRGGKKSNNPRDRVEGYSDPEDEDEEDTELDGTPLIPQSNNSTGTFHPGSREITQSGSHNNYFSNQNSGSGSPTGVPSTFGLMHPPPPPPGAVETRVRTNTLNSPNIRQHAQTHGPEGGEEVRTNSNPPVKTSSSDVASTPHPTSRSTQEGQEGIITPASESPSPQQQQQQSPSSFLTPGMPLTSSDNSVAGGGGMMEDQGRTRTFTD